MKLTLYKHNKKYEKESKDTSSREIIFIHRDRKRKRKKGGMLMESNFYNHFQNIERVFPLEFVASHRRQIYIDLMC